ncbi:hypothetical protein MKW92_025597 [Papaver armeniacum]|nr:hypothetical protein MKW92_025597 [Papaver armeniacum]
MFYLGHNCITIWVLLKTHRLKWMMQWRRLLISVQTDSSVPNTLVIANCEVVTPRVAAAEHISQFNEEARSPFVKKYKTIIHPGENMEIVATHTNSPDVLIWDADAQLTCHIAHGSSESRPDLVRSVGDDSYLILWDARTGTSPTVKVEKSHNADLHCVDWNRHNENLILAGVDDESEIIFCAITSGCMFVLRNLTADGVGTPIYKFDGHKAAVLCVQWCPDKASVYGSAAEDGFLNVWDHEKIWRMSDLIYRPEEEVLEELEKFKSHILACSSKS